MTPAGSFGAAGRFGRSWDTARFTHASIAASPITQIRVSFIFPSVAVQIRGRPFGPPRVSPLFYRAAAGCTTMGHGTAPFPSPNPASAATFVRRAKGGRNAGVQGLRSGPILVGPLVARYTGGMDAPEKRRRYCPTPAWLVYGFAGGDGLALAVGAVGLAVTGTRAMPS